MAVKKCKVAEYVKLKLSTSDAWAKKALVVIYNNQTADEQSNEMTKYHNDIGFSVVDAEILSSFAKQYLAKNWLSTKQMILLKKKIKKYWKQVIAVSNEERLAHMVMLEA